MVTIHLNPSIPLLCRPSVVHFLCFLSPLVIMPLLHTLSPISNYSLWEQDKDPDNFYEDDLLEVHRDSQYTAYVHRGKTGEMKDLFYRNRRIS